MQTAVAPTLDPSDYTVVPHVAVLDTFRMTNDDGSFVADITEAFLDKTIAHMNGRETLTGDLSPLVIGHTKKGQAEVAQPTLVGFARNWHKGVLGDTGRPCAFIDAWVRNDKVALARDFPRRSCEVYVHLYECDPISLLGATTPARDLGLMLLSREGSLTIDSPGEMKMPDEVKKDDKPKAEPKETGEAKGVEAMFQQIMARLDRVEAAVGGAQPAAPSAPGGDGKNELSDDEWEKLLGGAGGAPGGDDKSRAGEPKVANSAGYPGGDNTHVMLARQVDALTVQLARRDVKDALTRHAATKQINPEDETLITDLVAVPPEIRARMIDRIGTNAPARLDAAPVMLNRALQAAVGGTGGKRIADDKEASIKLQREAVAKKISYEQAVREAGYTL